MYLKLLFVLLFSFINLSANEHIEKNINQLKPFIYNENSNNINVVFTKLEQEYLQNKKILRVHTEPSWIPFSFLNSNRKPDGYMYDLVQLIAQRTNLELKIELSSYDQAVKDTIQNNIDLTVYMPKLKENQDKVLFLPMTTYYYTEGLVSKNGYTQLSQLNSKTVGYIAGLDHFNKLFPKINFVAYEDDKSMLLDVVKGKIDAAVDCYATIDYLINELSIKNMKLSYIQNAQELYFHIATSNENKILFNILEKVITRQDMDKLKQKWGIVTQNKSFVKNQLLFNDLEKNYIQSNTFSICLQPNLNMYQRFENKKVVGIMADIFNEISKKSGLKFDYIDTTSSQDLLLQKISNKECDLVSVIVSDTKDYPLIVPSKTFYKEPLVILGNINSLFDPNHSDFTTHKFIVPYKSFEEKLKKIYPNIQTILKEDIAKQLELIQNDPYLHLITVKNIAESIIQQYGFDKFRINYKFENINIPGSIGVYQDHLLLLSIINRTLDSFDNQVIKNIVANYSIKEYRITNNYKWLLYVVGFFAVLVIMLQARHIKTIDKQKYKDAIAREKEKRLIEDLKKTQSLAKMGNWRNNLITGEVYWDDTVYEMFEIDPVTVLDVERIKKTIHPDEYEKLFSAINSLTVNNPVVEIEIKFLRSSGKVGYGYDKIIGSFDENNNLIEISGYIQDITEKALSALKTKKLQDEFSQKLQEEVRVKTTQLRIKDELLSDNVFYSKTDPKGVIVDVSNAFCKLTGYSREELIGRKHSILKDPSFDMSVYKQMWETITTGKTWRGEFKSKAKDGHSFWVDVTVTCEYDDNQELIGYYAIRNDITARKEFEKQQQILFEQTKMAALGEMIGNIAHQWRQPLSVISTAATGLQLQKEHGILTDQLFDEECNMINENAQFLSKTIDDFRNYIIGDSKPKLFSIKNDTDNFLKLIDSSIKNYHIQVILSLEEHVKIKGYPNELIQCFINIFNNAKDALVLNHIDEDHRYIFISQYIENDNVIIEFKDNAGGIPRAILSKIFEPYFTTKHQANGTGLGLHMTYNLIVHGMGGSIVAQNEKFVFNDQEYIGAKFSISLPIS